LDFAIITILIFFLWFAAKKTKKLLKRLEPDDKKLVRREFIVIKADLTNVSNSHLITEEPPAAAPESVAAEPEGVTFEVEELKAEAEPAGDGSIPEFSWEPAETIEIGAR